MIFEDLLICVLWWYIYHMVNCILNIVYQRSKCNKLKNCKHTISLAVKWFFRKYFAYFTLYLSHIIAVRNFRKIYSLFWKFSNKFYLKFPMPSFCSRTSNVPFFSTKCLTLKWFRRMEFYLRFWVLFWIMNLCDFMIFNGWFIFSY